MPEDSITPQYVRIDDVIKQYGVTYRQLDDWVTYGHLPLAPTGEGLRYELSPEVHTLLPSLIAALPAQQQPTYANRRAAARLTVPREGLLDSAGVYVLHMAPYFKIGRSERPSQRIAGLMASLPVRPELFVYFETTRSAEIEGVLHWKFEAVRTNGEWFLLQDQDLLFLRQLEYHFNRHPYQWLPGSQYRLEGIRDIFETLEDAIDYLGSLAIPE
jgi:hypothetical protein